MKFDYEEKTFETYFNAELTRKVRHFFAPGQVAEGHLGFDMMVRLPWLMWRLFLPELFESGWRVGLRRADIDELGSEFNRYYRDFRANLFLQYKRPDYLASPLSSERASWNAPYFRFEIDEKQRDILLALAQAGQGRAEVLYAAPRLESLEKLIEAANRKRIIPSSQLVRATSLAGHKRCSYSASSGAKAVGHSEPEELQGFDIETYFAEAETLEPYTFTVGVKELSKVVWNAVQELDEASDILKTARRIEIYSSTGETRDDWEGTWLDALFTLRAFRNAFGIQPIMIS